MLGLQLLHSLRLLGCLGLQLADFSLKLALSGRLHLSQQANFGVEDLGVGLDHVFLEGRGLRGYLLLEGEQGGAELNCLAAELLLTRPELLLCMGSPRHSKLLVLAQGSDLVLCGAELLLEALVLSREPLVVNVQFAQGGAILCTAWCLLVQQLCALDRFLSDLLVQDFPVHANDRLVLRVQRRQHARLILPIEANLVVVEKRFQVVQRGPRIAKELLLCATPGLLSVEELLEQLDLALERPDLLGEVLLGRVEVVEHAHVRSVPSVLKARLRLECADFELEQLVLLGGLLLEELEGLRLVLQALHIPELALD